MRFGMSVRLLYMLAWYTRIMNSIVLAQCVLAAGSPFRGNGIFNDLGGRLARHAFMFCSLSR